MKVGDLKQLLNQYPDDHEVVIQERDEKYSRVHCAAEREAKVFRGKLLAYNRLDEGEFPSHAAVIPVVVLE